MFEPCFPVGVRMQDMEFVFAGMSAALGVGIGAFPLFLIGIVDAVVSGQHWRCFHEVDASLVERHGVKRGQNAYVGHYGRIVMVPAVAFGRHIHDETDVEIGLIVEHSLGVFGYLIIKAFGSVPVGEHCAVKLAYSHALSAAYAL